jgi:hypothetical protein
MLSDVAFAAPHALETLATGQPDGARRDCWHKMLHSIVFEQAFHTPNTVTIEID